MASIITNDLLLVQQPSVMRAGDLFNPKGGMKMRHTWYGCVSAMLLAGFQTAVAQTVDSDTGALAEIVVTAQKRGERLQDVPISVIATSNEQLTAAGVNSTEALGIVVPGLSLQ